MKELSRKGLTFKMAHITYNRKTGNTDGLRKVNRCQARAALPREGFAVHPDLYFPYKDLSLPKTDQNRLCRKSLIKFAAFPPSFETVKIIWYA